MKNQTLKNIKTLGSVACVLALPLFATVVVTGCAGDRYHESTGEGIDDTATTARVKSALGNDARYKYDNIHVATFKGTVELSGFVESGDARSHAVDIVRAVEGVHDVENKISVKS